MYYIGLDVHKKTISYCVKDAAGHVHREGKIGSTRRELDAWIKTLPEPRMIAMEATIFTGWIYDHLLPHAEKVKVAHPLMLRAIAAAKKKNDRIDASKIADCLRCDFLPECHMASTEIRDRRRTLRYRNLVMRQMVQMKNRVSGLLMESGVSYDKQRLHKMGYFTELFSTNEEISDSIRPLLRLSREHILRGQRLDRALTSSLERDPLLSERLRRLRTIPGVGPIPAASGCRTGSVSHLLLPFLAICSSDHAGRMPGARTQSKLPIEIVAGNRQPSSHVCTQPQTHAFRSGFKPGTNVGAGCSCHPTGCEYHRSTRVPLHPVWPRPVARF
jgi:transposase